jgi:hypothetical protein
MMPVAIQAYFDGSRSAKQPRGERLTLASYMATSDCWSELGRRWNRLLAGDGKRPSCRFLHMKDLQALRGEFSREKGWNEEARGALLRDMNNDCLSPLSRVDFKDQFYGAVCTIELDDYERAQPSLPALHGRTPEQVCLDYVLHVGVAMIPRLEPDGDKAGTAELFFDRNEPFFKHVDRLWRSRSRKDLAILRHVSNLDTVDMSKSPPLQAVDFLAWSTNRAFTNGDLFFNVARCLTVPVVGMRLDYEKLMQEYGGDKAGS